MIKLTAEKARERIEHLKAWQASRGLTLREEEYLQAMEIALTVLESEDSRIATSFSPVSLADYIKGFNVEGMTSAALSAYIVAFVEHDK